MSLDFYFYYRKICQLYHFFFPFSTFGFSWDACTYLSWRGVTCWMCLGALDFRSPVLSTSTYLWPIESPPLLHGVSSSVKQSSSWQLSGEEQRFVRWHYTVLRMWAVPNEMDPHPHPLFSFKCLETNFEDTTTVSLIGFLNVKNIIPNIMHRFEISIYTMH